MFMKMLVRGVALDPLTSEHLIILKNEQESKSLTISIGISEANAIISEMGDIYPPRPIIHDLTKDAISAMGGNLTQVSVTDLKHGTFYAVVELEMDGNKIELDSRPSDAIALALRFDAPIMVSKEVLEKSSIVDVAEESGNSKKWKEFLENLSPVDFGKYTV